jgi:hypothetical protein
MRVAPDAERRSPSLQTQRQPARTQSSRRRWASSWLPFRRAFVCPSVFPALTSSQAAFEMMAARFPGCFNGYRLDVREAHQSGKVLLVSDKRRPLSES